MSESFDFKVMDDSASDSDLLKDGTHQRIADRLFDLITQSGAEGLTIGLEGSWGSGKSTVVNLLRKKLEEANEAFVFYIDSWVHEGDYLRRAFLEGFAEQLQEKGVDGQKLEKIKNEITNKVVVKHTDTSPKTKPLGTALALMSIFMLPIGFSFIDNSCDTLTLGSDLSPNWLFILGIHLVFIPIVVAFVAWYRNKKNGLTSVFWTTETTETTTTETTEEPEKTSIEFEKFFRKLLEIANEKGEKNIVCVIDNLDRINPRDALKIWSTLQVFVQSKNPNGRSDDLSRVWIIVPYDESGLRLLWDKDEQGNNKPLCSKSFFDKSFQLRIEVPKMLFEGWEDYAKKIIEASLIGFEEQDKEIVLETLKRGRDKISDAPSPREIKTYVNQVGFLYGLHKRNNISLVALCFYVDLKYLHSKSVEEIKQSLIAGNVLPQDQVLGLLNDKNEIEKELCGIIFNVDAEKGIELLLDNPVIEALDKDDEEEMKKLTKNHEDAVLTFIEKIMTENQYDCKKYISLLMKVFGPRIEKTLSMYIMAKQDSICEQMKNITSIENLCTIFQIVKRSANDTLLSRLSETYVANQHERLMSDNIQSVIGDVLKSYECMYDVVADPNLIYLDYAQLGVDRFRQVADAVEIEKIPSFARYIKNVDSLDEHYSKKIEPNSPELASLSLQLVRLGCCAGCLQWNKTLNAINNLIVVKPNYNLNMDGFAQYVTFISILQEYDLKEEVDIIKTLLNKPAFWHYVSTSKKGIVKQIAAYLLAKYYDDFNFPQMQHVGQSANGIALVKTVFEEKNDDVIAHFCKKINATRKGDFIWALTKNPKYQLIGGIIERQLNDEQHWFFNVDNPFECFANAVEYMADNGVQMRLLDEFKSQARLISRVNTSVDVSLTNRLKACSILLESDDSRAIVGKVKNELAQKSKEDWLTALNDNTELLKIVCKCKEIDEKPLEELKNEFADAFVQYVRAELVGGNQNDVALEKVYDCVKDSFKKYISEEIANVLIECKFAVPSTIRDFLIEKIDYEVFVDKSKDVTKIIKELVEHPDWTQLEFVVALVDKLGARFLPEKHYTEVMEQPLKSLMSGAAPKQIEIIKQLCKFFRVNFENLQNEENENKDAAS